MGRQYNFFTFLREQFSTLYPTTVDLTGRTVIVTGSNIGLGKEAARQFLAMHPAKLILAVRSIKKGQAAAREIIEATGHTQADVVEVWELDLGSFASTNSFADRVERELQRLDILVESAGLATGKWSVTPEGYETTLQTNVISTGLLAALLLPILSRTAELLIPQTAPLKPHLVIVASDVHCSAKFEAHQKPKPIQALNDQTLFDAKDRYETTKLLDVFMAREFAKLPAAKNVVISAICPGFCFSSLRREFDSTILHLFERIFCRTEEVGAYNYTFAALTDYSSGSYISSCKVVEPSVFADSPAGLDAQARCWQEMKDIWITAAPATKDVLGP